MKTYSPTTNIHGRSTIAGMDKYLTPARTKLIKDGEALRPHTVNGITDPFSYYHVTDAILSIQIGDLWSSAELAKYLNVYRPQIQYDPVTVGRIVADIAENLEMAYGHKVIHTKRWAGGRVFWTANDIEGRIALERLLADLFILCKARWQGQRSPLTDCPSVLM